MQENVTALRSPPKTAPVLGKGKVNPRKISRAERALRRQTWSAAGIGAVALTLTGLSLHDLQHGVQLVTGLGDGESTAMAVGIDLGFIALELAMVTVGDKLRRQISKFAKPAIFGTLATSAAMNAFAFAEHADSTTLRGQILLASAIAIGLAIPGMIYALTRVGAGMYIDSHNRKA